MGLAELKAKIRESAASVAQKAGKELSSPTIGVILGTGLGDLADEVENRVAIPYKEIPHFPISTAPGHKGNLVLGKLSQHNLVLMQGRFHTYEGYSQREVTFAVRVMKELGVRTLIVTNACGGLNRHFNAGEIMIISDHINLTGDNPLIGPHDEELGPRFPVMFHAYDPDLRALAKEVGLKNQIHLREGVYAGIKGPAFFTPAELRHLMLLGADALGMSTVPEVIAARHAGIRVLGLSTITDMAIPDTGHHADEAEIIKTAAATGKVFKELLKQIIVKL